MFTAYSTIYKCVHKTCEKIHLYRYTMLDLMFVCILGLLPGSSRAIHDVHEIPCRVNNLVDNIENPMEEGLECFEGKTDLSCPDPDIEIYLYQSNYIRVVVDQTNVDALDSTSWDPSKIDTIIVHGFGDDETTPTMAELIGAHVVNGSFNVFFLNWHNYSKSPCYISAVKSIYPVGRCVAEFVDMLYEKHHKCPIRLVGFSLGAHVCGAIGSSLNNFYKVWILGLDPGAVFGETEEKFLQVLPVLNDSYVLDPKDAFFVEAIVTNCGKFGRFCNTRSGGIQFCINGGSNQPQCSKTVLQMCPHRQAACYLAHVVRSPKSAPYIGYKEEAETCATVGKRCHGNSKESAIVGGDYTQNVTGVFCVRIDDLFHECLQCP